MFEVDISGLSLEYLILCGNSPFPQSSMHPRCEVAVLTILNPPYKTSEDAIGLLLAQIVVHLK